MQHAVVTVELIDLTGIDPAHTTRVGKGTPFLTAHLGGRFIGRSAGLSAGQTHFDFAKDAARWREKKRTTRERITVAVHLYADRDDGPPDTLLRMKKQLRFNTDRATSTLHTVGRSGATLRVRLTVRPLLALGVTAIRGAAGGPAPHVVLNGPTGPVVQVDFIHMLGVHEPGAPPGLPSTEVRTSLPRTTGFEREGGRVYLNRAPNGAWRSRSQTIEVAVRLSVVQGMLPPSAVVEWSIRVPDDPIVEHPATRVEALEVLRTPLSDPSFRPTTPAPAGPRWAPNLGASVEAEPFDKVDPHTLTRIDARTCRTSIAGDVSRVLIHCPSGAGDRFIVEATVVDPAAAGATGPGALYAIEAVSGMITMWHRIEVRYSMLPGADSIWDVLPGINPAFAPLCITFDFLDLVLSGGKYGGAPALSYAQTASRTGVRPQGYDPAVHLAFNADDEFAALVAMAGDPHRFPNPSEPGTFNVGAGVEASPIPLPPPGQSNTLFSGRMTLVHVGGNAGIVLPDRLPPNVDVHDINAVAILWRSGQRIVFKTHLERIRTGTPARNRFVLRLEKVDMNQHFVARDGRLLPRDEFLFGPFDYGLTGDVDVDLMKTPPHTKGASPPSAATGRLSRFFAGRLIVFPHHEYFRDRVNDTRDPEFAARMTTVIAHEFGHSLGTPHKCGHWAFRHDGEPSRPLGSSCPMNYWVHAVRRNGQFVEGSVDQMSLSFCGMHMSQIRRVVLQDNPSFQGW